MYLQLFFFSQIFILINNTRDSSTPLENFETLLKFLQVDVLDAVPCESLVSCTMGLSRSAGFQCTGANSQAICI